VPGKCETVAVRHRFGLPVAPAVTWMGEPVWNRSGRTRVRRSGQGLVRPRSAPHLREVSCTMSLADVASTLWREREALELLLFKLEEEQLVLAGGRSRWLAHATREVEMVLDRIRQTEVLRAVQTEALAAELGLPPNASLSVLADAAGDPWTELFREHRAAFLTLTAEITAMAEANRDLLTSGQRAVREAMLAVTGAVQTYGRRGTATAEAGARSQLVDEAM
jgi:hypothetical protein